LIFLIAVLPFRSDYPSRAGNTLILLLILWSKISSPSGFCLTISQFSGDNPACPILTFCFLVGFFPWRKAIPPFRVFFWA